MLNASTSSQGFLEKPLHRVIAVFHDRDDASETAADLASNGFDPSDIEYACGVEGLASSHDEASLVSKLTRSLRNATYDRVLLNRFDAALDDGECVLAVHVHKPEEKVLAAKILQRHHADHIEYFGLAMTETISHPVDTEQLRKDDSF
jgi:hypothetical protein